MLVVGPNPLFLRYIAAGAARRSVSGNVRRRTVADLCVPRVEIGATDSTELARLKGDARMLEVLQRAVRAAITAPAEAVRVPFGARTVVVEADEIAAWIDTVTTTSKEPRWNKRRDALRAIAATEMLRRTGKDDAWRQATPLRKALDAAWPQQQPKAVLATTARRPRRARRRGRRPVRSGGGRAVDGRRSSGHEADAVDAR